ncbi:general secretion pathway protein GspB [Marinobacter sp.]|uniref:general secretion pathway protein GspB n=1 Tax=Marinobacter sp. TaxID=50741 RepID=UPI002B4813B4|nr:general secretion pathway protein GspB [Marinobacter sp.]HKK54900.1 general secretion pathway protein GspB [Marinobacter sp.]
MSYILDALRKSESERHQGKVPDLGQQVQFVHKRRKKSSPLVVLVAAALVLNAVVLAVVFWPETPVQSVMPAPQPAVEPEPAPAPEPEPKAEPVPERAPEPMPEPEPVARERPTIIVPSPASSGQSARAGVAGVSSGPVPHLVEMPLAFQRSVPDLVFNSHIYASDPSARRVMINNNYLKAGDSFDGIQVQQITEEGVVLSLSGRSFRVGSMRDWVRPD